MEQNGTQQNELKLLSNYTNNEENSAVCKCEFSSTQEQVQNGKTSCAEPAVTFCSDDGGTNDSHHDHRPSSEKAMAKRVKRFDDLYEEVCSELKKNGKSIDLCEKLKNCGGGHGQSFDEKTYLDNGRDQTSVGAAASAGAVKDERYADEENDDDLKRIQLVISYYPSILTKFTNSIEKFYDGKDESRAKELLSLAKSMGEEKSDEAIKVLNNALLVTPPVTEEEWMKGSEQDWKEKLTHDKLGLEWFLGIRIPRDPQKEQWSSSEPEQPQQREEVEQETPNPSPSVRDHKSSNHKVKDMLVAQIYLERARRFNYTGAHESCILDIFTSIYYGAEKTFEIVYCLASSYKALGRFTQANLILQHSIEILRASQWTNQRKSELTLQIVKQLKEIKSMNRTDDDGQPRERRKGAKDEDKINDIALFVGPGHEISSSPYIPREDFRKSPPSHASSANTRSQNKSPSTSTESMQLYCGQNPVLIAASDAVQLQYDEQYGRHIIAKKTIPPGKTLILETPYAWSLYPDMYRDFCQHCCKKAESWVPCQRCSTVVFCSWDCRREAERYHKFECPILNLLLDSDALGQMALLCYRTITNTELPLLLQKLVSNKMGPHNFKVPTVDGDEGTQDKIGNNIGEENDENRINCQSQNSSHGRVSSFKNDASSAPETNKEERIRLLGLNSAGKLDPGDYVSIMAQTTNIEARPSGDILKRILAAIYLTLCLRFTEFFDYHQSSSSKCQGSPATESNLDIDSSMTSQVNNALRQNKIDDGKNKTANAPERELTTRVGEKASQMEMSDAELRVTILLFKHLQSTSCNAYEINFVDKASTAKQMQILDVGGCTYPTISLTNHSCNPNIYRYNRGKLCIVKSVLEIQQGQQLLDSYGFVFTLRTKHERKQFLQSNYFFNCECEACANDWPKYAELSDHCAVKSQEPSQKKNMKSVEKNVRHDCNSKTRKEAEELETKFQTYKQWLYDDENEKIRAHYRSIESTFTRYISVLQKLYQVPDKRLVVCQETLKMLWNLFPDADASATS